MVHNSKIECVKWAAADENNEYHKYDSTDKCVKKGSIIDHIQLMLSCLS